MEVSLSMHKMEQIQKDSVLFISVSYMPYTGMDSGERGEWQLGFKIYDLFKT